MKILNSDPSLIERMEHEDITPRQLAFNIRTKRAPFNKNGKSILSGKPTKWNEHAGKYDRILSSEKDEYREMFRKRMKKVHGTDNLLTDPDHQKKMLANRKISGVYKARDKSEFTYTGSYEEDFIEMMDKVFEWNMADILMPAPMTIKYTIEGKDHFFIPDVYITSLDLIIEIKASDNKHYRERDKEIEFAKDNAVERTDHNYHKLFDKDYNGFLNKVRDIKNEGE